MDRNDLKYTGQLAVNYLFSIYIIAKDTLIVI